jgi:glycosyltransferase involved in cell wall biosynthesis
MDLCADRLVAYLSDQMKVECIRPAMHLRFSSLPLVGRKGLIHIADRLWNRQWDYPRYARRFVAGRFDFYHIVDHSYAQLVSFLPAARTGVYCHDIDAFLCLVDSERDKRPGWFRAMSRRILRGLQSARLVFHNSMQTRRDLLQYGLVDEQRLVYAPLGVAEEFSLIALPNGTSENRATVNSELLKRLDELNRGPWLLHVGSCIPRKRVDVLLRVLHQARRRVPDLRLLKAGGEWTAEHQSLIAELKLESAIVHLKSLDRAELAECYRQATIVMVPSQSEGFGLPVIEAMACGAPVIASDIPVLRESGGDGAVFAPVGDIEAWVDGIDRVIRTDASLPSRERRLAWASRFSWQQHAKIIAEAYRRI